MEFSLQKSCLVFNFSVENLAFQRSLGISLKYFSTFRIWSVEFRHFCENLASKVAKKIFEQECHAFPPLDHSVQSQNEKSNLVLTCRFKVWRENPENFQNLTVWQVVWKFKWSIRSTKMHFWRIDFINLIINTITQNNSNLF